MTYDLVTTGGGQGKTDWEIHKHNCQDVLKARARRSVNAINAFESNDLEAFIANELKVELADMGYSRSDYRIMPCCK